MTIQAICFEDLTIKQLEALVGKVGGLEKVPHILSGELKVRLEVNRTLDCSVALDPATFIGDNWSYWRGPPDGDGLTGEIEQDERSFALKEIDWTNVTFAHCLVKDEVGISGDEKLQRLKAAGHIRFGGNVFLSLWRDYQANKEKCVLEWLYNTKNVICLDFMGSVLRNPNKAQQDTPKRCVFYVHRVDEEWQWSYCGSLSGHYPWEKHNLSAVLKENGTY